MGEMNYFGNDTIKTQLNNVWLNESKQYFAFCQQIFLTRQLIFFGV